MAAKRVVSPEVEYLGEAAQWRGTLKRNTTMKNPWNAVKKKPLKNNSQLESPGAQKQLDENARKQIWYCLDISKESAIAMLENRIDRISSGAFVIFPSSKDFATLCFVYAQNLFNVQIALDAKGLYLKLQDIKSPKKFPTLSELVDFFSSKKQKGLPTKLDPKALEEDLHEYDRHDEIAMANPAYATSEQIRSRTDSLVGDIRPRKDSVLANRGMENPGYVFTDPGSTRMGMSNPGYQGLGLASFEDDTVLPEDGGYVALHNGQDPGDEGFITISKTSFTPKQGIKGVSFQPCQTSEWFFMGLSNITQNQHGKKDQHYDDIDYCIFIMGHGKATARENEDEVGPYIEYQAGDLFEIKVNMKSHAVEYYQNKTKFHSSFLPDEKLPLWVSQAFHPVNGSQTLIANSKWIT
eukprot:m.93130 g.93130  ORF g.93130 m.93130 type:complete len:409 (+) comp13384_c0_seq3:141-1367(+)